MLEFHTEMIRHNMLKIKKLTVLIEDKEILENIDLQVAKGETVVIFGPNGSGKTSLLKAILGIGGTQIKSGKILFKNKVLNNLPIDKRAKLGISLMFQKPPRISGIKLYNLLNLINSNQNHIEQKAKDLNFQKFLDRDINSSLSGGETKRSELLQLTCQKIDLFLFDEPDSGVDADNMKLIGEEIKKITNNKKKGSIIITHNGDILKYINTQTGYVLIDGKIAYKGNPLKIWGNIQKNGYEKYKY